MEKHSKTKKRIEKRKRRSSGSDHEVTVKISKTNKKQKAKLRKPHLSSSSSSSSSTSSSNSSSSISSSSSSNNTSSSSDSSESEDKHHRQHAEKKRVKKMKQKVQKKAKQRSKHEPVLEEEPSTDIPLDLMEKPKAMAPMTKEEWEKRQSVVKRVYDESTGRNRLIKGDGEVIEEIVSKERHKAINQQATKGDGNFFQTTLSSSLKK